MKLQNPFRFLCGVLLAALASAVAPAVSGQSASTYVTNGLEKARQGDLDGAIADYTKALDLNSSYLGAYNNRGLARTTQGNFEGAIADFGQVIQLKPTMPEAYYHRGYAALLQGNFDSAIADFSKAVELRPDYWTAYFHRGLARDCQTNFEGARADYARALESKGATESWASYLVLHNALLARRLGLGNDARLAATTGWSSEWTKSVAMFLNGKLSDADLRKRAGAASGDDKIRQQTEALYFIGAMRRMTGDKAVARGELQESFDGSAPSSLVHRLAKTELDRY